METKPITGNRKKQEERLSQEIRSEKKQIEDYVNRTKSSEKDQKQKRKKERERERESEREREK